MLFELYTYDFIEAGMPGKDASGLANEMKKAINHAAHVLQILRRVIWSSL